MYISRLFFLAITFIFLGCKTEIKEENPVQEYIEDTKSIYAPDKRTVLFDVTSVKNNGTHVLEGKSSTQEGLLYLRDLLKKNNITFLDSVQTLPASDVLNISNAIVNISVANLRSLPKHSAELATQATLGTPVSVLMNQGDWYYIQTPDQYLSWVDAGGISLMTNERYNQWRNTEKIMYLKTYGHAYKDIDKKERLSDLVAGNILEVLEQDDSFYTTRFPDGRQGYVDKEEAMGFNEWATGLEPNGVSLVNTSKTLMGVPYLWGGTSTKGIDCSGFTKTVYFLNGMIIPRDASQQVHTGVPIDSVQRFDDLELGDLLFFGRKATDSTAEKVVHVGMWIGNNQFIHASEKVRISSMEEKSPNYDVFNKNRYLRSKRLLNTTDKAIIDLRKSFTFNEIKD